MKSKILKVLKICTYILLAILVSIASYLTYKANSIFKKAWENETLHSINWNNYSEDFQVVAKSVFKRRDLRMNFSRMTVERYLNGEGIRIGDWHLLGFLTYSYSKLIVSEEQVQAIFLNYTHMGSNIRGFSTASQSYFDKSIKDIDLSDSALLFGISIAPGYYSPYKNIKRAKDIRSVVLEHLRANGGNSERIDIAIKKPIYLTRKIQ